MLAEVVAQGLYLKPKEDLKEEKMVKALKFGGFLAHFICLFF